MTNVQEQIREILSEYGRLATPVADLTEATDLFAVGLDSVAIVNVLMGLEEKFNIELPDELLSRRSFASIAALTDIVLRLREPVPSK